MKKQVIPNVLAPTHNVPPEMMDEWKGKSFGEVLTTMADNRKVELAMSIINQIAEDGDPAAMKILQGIMEKNNADTEEIKISDDRFREIIKVVAARI